MRRLGHNKKSIMRWKCNARVGDLKSRLRSEKISELATMRLAKWEGRMTMTGLSKEGRVPVGQGEVLRKDPENK